MNEVYKKWDRFCDQKVKAKYLEYEEAVIKYNVIVAKIYDIYENEYKRTESELKAADKINDIYENEYKQAKAELDVAEAEIQEYLDEQYLWEPPPMKSDRILSAKEHFSGTP